MHWHFPTALGVAVVAGATISVSIVLKLVVASHSLHPDSPSADAVLQVACFLVTSNRVHSVAGATGVAL